MKQYILLALMALTLSLGVSCKKETELVREEVKIEKKQSISYVEEEDVDETDDGITKKHKKRCRFGQPYGDTGLIWHCTEACF